MSSDVKKTTIDNLGAKASARWAQDQRQLDPKLITESRSVPFHTQVSTTEPYYESQLEDLFAFNKKNVSFAKFEPPAGYHSHQRAIFTFQIIPSMGAMERQEGNLEKVSSLKELEQDKEKKPELMEVDLVEKMLKKIGLLDKYLTVINSRRQQFHKG